MFWQFALGNQHSDAPVSTEGFRYWRVTNFHSDWDAHTGMSEMKFRDDMGNTLVPDSHTYSNAGTSDFSSLWDDDLGTGSVIYNVENAEIVMDFGVNPVRPYDFYLYPVSYAADADRLPTTYTIQYSDDNVNWTTLFQMRQYWRGASATARIDRLSTEDFEFSKADLLVIAGVPAEHLYVSNQQTYTIEGVANKNAVIKDMALYVIES